LKERALLTKDSPLFPNAQGEALTRDGVAHLLRKHADAAARTCPSLSGKRVTPHVLRHSAAMRLLEAGVDRAVIALWLGHESVETTQVYFHADMGMKRRALARSGELDGHFRGFRPKDELLAFLTSL
jgi:site-specific recombinase XerD